MGVLKAVPIVLDISIGGSSGRSPSIGVLGGSGVWGIDVGVVVCSRGGSGKTRTTTVDGDAGTRHNAARINTCSVTATPLPHDGNSDGR